MKSKAQYEQQPRIKVKSTMRNYIGICLHDCSQGSSQESIPNRKNIKWHDTKKKNQLKIKH